MIELRDVVKRYGATTALDCVTLTVEAGSVTVLIGASGSGKSTLLRLVNRLIEPDGGSIAIDGHDIRAGDPVQLRRRIGYVIQSIGLFPHWSVARNIATVPELLGWSRSRIAARVDELLDLLGLDPARFRDRHPHQLSGGQQQRVGVARALAAEPALLLMDEPFGALDPVTRKALQAELRRIQRRLGTTVVLVTHDVDEALSLGDQLVLLDHGRIVQAGPPRQLLTMPVDRRVSDFFGTAQLGPRLFGLHRVGALMRRGDSADGPPLPADGDLNQALSAFLQSGCDRLPVVDRDGSRLGALHWADLLRPPLRAEGAAPVA